jgi:hypothetical protein
VGVHEFKHLQFLQAWQAATRHTESNGPLCGVVHNPADSAQITPLRRPARSLSGIWAQNSCDASGSTTAYPG